MVLWADVVGYIGGAILAGCILPQLVQLWRTKSSKDISWAFNVLYLIGLVLTLIYLYAKQALATFICVALQIVGGLFMLGMKVWLELLPRGRRRPEGAAAAAAKQGSCGGGGSGGGAKDVDVVARV